MTTTHTLRAIGVVRVSSTRGREDCASPDDQRDRFSAECERRGWIPVRTTDELDVSGGTALSKRRGLREAVEAIERGEAEILVAPYFDRLCRSLRVQDEVVSRVEAKGGSVLALDFGEVTNGTASQWLSSTVLGAMNEYYRRAVGERIKASHVRAVEAGHPPYAERPVGYIMENKSPLVPHPTEAPIVAKAFELRAEGASVNQVCKFLHDNGIKRSRSPVRRMLMNRLYLGELHFGSLSNLNAHPAIVDPDVWQRAQRASAPRGRYTKSEFLLARLGVLRCASCGSTLAGTTHHNKSGTTRMYKCSKSGAIACEHQVAITADVVEQVIVDATKARLKPAKGRASAERRKRDAAAAAADAQENLDRAIRAFSGLEGETAAIEKIAELRQIRDEAERVAHELGASGTARTISAASDWGDLTLAEQRALIRTAISTATIAPGVRGVTSDASRIAIEFCIE